jgi:pimeloyl-ACP methyl ester carboxylesterase
MPSIRVDDVNLYYEVHGTGPHVVLCHGIGSNRLHWWQQVCALRESYTVVIYDQRGFGSSSSGERGPAAFADDLTALVDHLQIKRTALLGQSLGGLAAAGFASRKPDRVTALILSNSGAGFVPMTPPPQIAAAAKVARNYLELLPAFIAQDKFRERHPKRAYLFESMAQLNAGFDIRGLGELATIRPDIAPIIAAHIPVLFIAAQDDERASMAMKQASELIPDSRVETIPNAGHLAFFEEPENYNRVVLQFLNKHAGLCG